MFRFCHLHTSTAAAVLRYSRARVIPHAALAVSARTYFVQFAKTPNDECMRFFVTGQTFLSSPDSSPSSAPVIDGAMSKDGVPDERGGPIRASHHHHSPRTLTFDATNQHLSPLAQALLQSLPMVDEVTIGHSFITVRRMPESECLDAFRRASAEVSEFRNVATSTSSTESDPSAQQPQPGEPSPSSTEASASSSSSTSTPRPSGEPNTTACSSADNNNKPADDEEAMQKFFAMLHWSELAAAVSALITDHLYSGQPHVNLNAPDPHGDTAPHPDDSEVVLAIKELLSETIRPQLQADGGDVRYLRWQHDTDGQLVIELLGACKSCKSSKTTLQDLIERTTRHWIPEVTGIVALARRKGVLRCIATGETVDETTYNAPVNGTAAAATESQRDEPENPEASHNGIAPSDSGSDDDTNTSNVPFGQRVAIATSPSVRIVNNRGGVEGLEGGTRTKNGT